MKTRPIDAAVAAAVLDSEASAAPRGRDSRIRLALSIAVPLAIAAVFAYLVVTHGHEITAAADRVSAATLAIVVALTLLTLLARTEAVVACLTAIGNRCHRRDIHAANSLTFLAATINHYASSIVRAALMRRIDRARAPTIPQMIMVDTSTTLIEGLLVVVLVVASAGALSLAWWIPVLALLAGICALFAAIAVLRRFRHIDAIAGLEVLAHSRQRLLVAALMAIVIFCQVTRTLVVLRAAGLHPTLLQAAATFVAAGIFSSLLAGPGAGTAGAPLVVFGHEAIGAAAAAGLVLSITTVLAGALYAAVGGPVFVWRLRRTT